MLDLQAASIWRDLREELPAVRGTVVDVGCGAQPYRGLLGPDVRYIGIDTANAKADFGYEFPDVLYFEGDTWPLPDDTADLVLATETLEHIPDPRGFLAEAARCLRPAGRLMLTVPFAARWHYVPHDYWRFTPSSLQMLLGEAGFGEIGVFARGNALTVAAQKTMALPLTMLFPQEPQGAKRIASQAVGILTLPVVAALAAAGNLSLHGAGGEDCLGYTVVATLTSEASRITSAPSLGT
jgi:SAM-dependent methyltransferase